MRKVLWIVVLAAMAFPLLSEQASARCRRSRSHCNQTCYTPAVQCCYTQQTYGAPTIYSAPTTQQPAGTPEPPRPTLPPKE